jgi:hypothetical protein
MTETTIDVADATGRPGGGALVVATPPDRRVLLLTLTDHIAGQTKAVELDEDGVSFVRRHLTYAADGQLVDRQWPVPKMSVCVWHQPGTLTRLGLLANATKARLVCLSLDRRANDHLRMIMTSYLRPGQGMSS